MNPQIAALLGAAIGIGLTLVGYSLFLTKAEPTEPNRDVDKPRPARPRLDWRRLTVAAIAGTAAWWATGWPVAGAAAAALAWSYRLVFGRDTAGSIAVERVEAVAAWTESVRDVVAAGAGLKQALAATARFAPPALEREVHTLAESMRTGTSADQALRAFAAQVADETADLVALALIAAHRRSGDLAALLDRLAHTARSEAAMRTRVMTSRARVRASARLISATAIVGTAILVVLNPAFLTFYNGLLGQATLAMVFAVGAHALIWLARLGRYQPPPRLIALEGAR